MSDLDHSTDKVCECCAFGVEMFNEMEREKLEKYGWVAHFVMDEPETPFNVNYHTHGLRENFKHKDLQICLCLKPQVMHSIATTVANNIKGGTVYEAGQVVYGVIGGNYPITFIDAKENGRDVLRIIFPDASGCLDPNDMIEPYGEQFK